MRLLWTQIAMDWWPTDRYIMTQISVLLAEDHTIVRKGIRSLLDEEPEIEVVGEAENGREAVAKAEELHPDIVVCLLYTSPSPRDS